MPDETEKLTVKVNDKEAVTALLYSAVKKIRAGLTVLLGHGAGAISLDAMRRKPGSADVVEWPRQREADRMRRRAS